MRTFSFKITRTCHKVLGHWSVWVFAVGLCVYCVYCIVNRNSLYAGAVSDAADSTGTFNSNSNNSGKPFCSEYKPWLEKPTVTWEPNGTCMAATYEGHDTLLSRSHTCKCQNSLAKKLGLCYTPVPDGCTFKSDNLLQNAINSILEDTCVIGDSLARHLAMAFLRRVDRPYEERDQFYYQSHVMFHHRTHKPLTLDEGEVCSEKAKAMSTDEGYKQLCTNAVAKDGTYDFEESMCNPLETSYNNAAGQKVGLRELSAKHHCDWQYHRTLEQNLWVKFLEEKKCHRLVYIGGHHWWKEPGAHENYAMLTDNILDFVSKHTSIKDVYHVLSPPGHPSCKSNAKEKNFNYKDEWSWDKTLKVQMDYWGINNIDRVRAKFPRIRTIEFVDTFQATDPRPDLHSEEDCLHYCHVGVPDVWAQFVLEYMQAHTNN